jgi:hypothetical protein
MSKKEKIIQFILILIGTFIWSLTMVRSGLKYDFGIAFWGPNGHDGIWHLSLINQLQKFIPPQNPVFSGTILNNYHWGFNLIAAILGKIFNNNSLVYFQILPIILGLTIGFFSYRLIKQNFKDKNIALLFTFLIYFSGSFGWIYTLIKSGQIGGESLFWSMQSISTLINPPFALSLVILLIGLIIWSKNNSSSKYSLAIINGLIFGLLAGIKIYSGILIGITLVVLWLFQFIKSKKVINYNFVTWVTTLIISVFILASLGVLKGSSFLEFKPFWFIHSMIESIDKFYLPQIASYRSSLFQNLSLIKFPLFLTIELILILTFLIGNMGLRCLGFIPIFQKAKIHKFSQLEKLVLTLMTISFLIPLFFVQKGTAWNTIQFFYYFIFFSNLFLAQLLAKLIKKRKISKIILVISILFLTSVGSIASLKDYLGNPPPAAIPNKEVEALNFLKEQPKETVLTYPYDKYLKNGLSTPIPIYAYETTAYVSAFSAKTIYLEDEMNLDITGFDWQARRLSEEKFFSTTDEFFARGFLLNNQIDYIYLVNGQKFTLSESQLQIEKIFDNGQVRIYQVQK